MKRIRLPRRHVDRPCIAIRARCGFSLIEVILALGLMAMIVYIVAGGIDFHLRQLTVRKTRIEEVQLARAVLRRIADDLRGVVVMRTTDFSSVGGLADAGAALLSDDPALADAATAASTEVTSLADTTTMPTTPGVYGNAFELQVDVSRIPRYEEYLLAGGMASGGATVGGMSGMPTLLSDVKTVTYFLINNASLGSAMAFDPTANGDWQTNGLPVGLTPQGLVRRVTDRAVARYASQTADMTGMNQQIELFAPEVIALQFRYFDGTQWLSDWDTESLGSVPTAVEISIVLDSAVTDAEAAAEDATVSLFEVVDPQQIHRLVVYLPVSEPIDSTGTTSSSSAGTSTGSNASGSSAAAGGSR